MGAPALPGRRRSKESWGFQLAEDAEKVVTVYPRGLTSAHIETTGEVIDWAFIESEHHLLWPYEDTADLMCQVPLPEGSLVRLPKLIQLKLPFHAPYDAIASLITVLEWEDPPAAESIRGGFSLGNFPRTVFLAAQEVLKGLGVRFYTAREPEPRDLPVLFLIDGTDYIIADDFDVEVPEFEHDDAWFKP